MLRSPKAGEDMTADGDWDLVVMTPLGERRGVLSLRTEASTLRRRPAADENSIQIFDGSADGASLAWKYQSLIQCR